MRIVHINTFDYANGASRSAYRLHDGLRRQGHDSQMYVNVKVTEDPTVRTYVQPTSLLSSLVRTARRLKLQYAAHRGARDSSPKTYFSDATAVYKDTCRQIPEGDIVQLHWVAEFIDYAEFFAWLPRRHPLVWTLHDMANFTGGCCFDLGCGKFVHQCGTCPQLHSKRDRDLSRKVWQRKRKYYNWLDGNWVHIVTPSRWLGDEVKRSPLLSRFRTTIIPYGLDTDVFQPQDRRIARELLGIPQDARVLLFVAAGLNEYRKGFQYLLEALAGVDDSSKMVLVSVGDGHLKGLEQFRYLRCQTIHNDRFLSFIYSAADIFVAPSLADNLPNTVLESIACGTPVVAFSVGGIPEMVRPGITGCLANPADSIGLRSAIVGLLRNEDKRLEMSVHCRRVALADYALNIQASRYLKIYEEMLNRNTPTRRDVGASEEVTADSVRLV